MILRDEHYIGTIVSFKFKRSYRNDKSISQIAAKSEIRRQEIGDRLTVLSQVETEAKPKLGDIQHWIHLIKENGKAMTLIEALLSL